MSVVFNQLCILLIFAVSGFTLCKIKVANSEHAQILSVLLVYVFLPCLTIKTFALELDIEYIAKKYMILVCSAILFLVLAIVMIFVARLFTKHSYDRNVYYYSLLIPNFGFFTYVLAEKIYGTEFLLDIMVFSIPANVFAYAVGICLLTKNPISIKGMLKQPAIISMIIGSILGIFQIHLPEIFITILDRGSSCMPAVGMILTGMVISEYDFKELFLDIKPIILVIFRLIIIPLVLVIILRPFVTEKFLLYVVLFYAMPCGLNTVIFPKLINENCKIGASLSFIANILSVVTIPLMINIIS